MKTFVIFFGKQMSDKGNPLDFDDKVDIYYRIMERFSLGDKYEVRIAKGYNNYLGDNRFYSQWRYEKGKLVVDPKEVTANAILERAHKDQVLFPEPNTKNVINTSQFKGFANSKWQVTKALPNFSPKSQLLTKLVSIEDAIKHIPTDRIVLKPNNGAKGEFIEFFQRDQISEMESFVKENERFVFIMQEFLETGDGIPGFVNGRHDLRLVYINNKICWVLTIRNKM